MEIFDKFIVVDEKAFTNLNQSDQSSVFSDVTHFAALEFKSYWAYMVIRDIGNASKLNVPLAQIVRYEWNEKGEQVIKETQILKIGSNYLRLNGRLFIIRILKAKEETTDQNPCQSLVSAHDNLTVKIGDSEITVSAAWLMSQSPVIDRMLNVEMKEKKQRLITLDELDINMEKFKEFLEAISLTALQTSIFPNPKNVLMLLKLADYFQVEWLKKRCEMHLINCVEIPLIDRFFLIEKYGLSNLKKYFLHFMSVDNLRAFFKTNYGQMLPTISTEFVGQLITRTC